MIMTLIGVVLLTIAVVIVILLNKRKAKKLLAEELDEIRVCGLRPVG